MTSWLPSSHGFETGTTQEICNWPAFKARKQIKLGNSGVGPLEAEKLFIFVQPKPRKSEPGQLDTGNG